MNHSPSREVEGLDVPRGNTQKNVNKEIIRYLIEEFPENNALGLADIPCGDGVFLRYLHTLFPNFSLMGGDMIAPQEQEGFRFQTIDARKNFSIGNEERFDIVTSISGVMMFGNTESYIENCCRHLVSGGTVIISNDNMWTVRDRLSFLLTGRVRRFKLFYEGNEMLTQNVPIQELNRLLLLNNVAVKTIRYTSFYPEDILFIPLSILLYPLQWLYVRSVKSGTADELRKKMFPFRALLCRHYFIVGRKDDNCL